MDGTSSLDARRATLRRTRVPLRRYHQLFRPCPHGSGSGPGYGRYGGGYDRRPQPRHRSATVFSSKVSVMTSTLTYLSRRDVEAAGVTPAEAREAVLTVFADHAAGLNKSLPKGSIEIAPGHGFQAMAAASESAGIATLKWVAMAPLAPGTTTAGINSLICVSDYGDRRARRGPRRELHHVDPDGCDVGRGGHAPGARRSSHHCLRWLWFAGIRPS